jgi:Ca2+-transporting ATPase
LSQFKPVFSHPHCLETDRLREDLRTDLVAGLEESEAARRLAEHGPNALPRGAAKGPLKVFLAQFHNPLVYVLLASAGLASLMGQWADAGVVLGVVVLNAIIGFVQEYRAGKELEALSSMVPERTLVVRSGLKKSVGAEDLVVGDLVLLASGDKVPADLRLVEMKSLKIEEAALTGESVPVEKKLEIVAEGASLGDRVNMAYGGTLVTYGTAAGIVVATGSATEIGKISSMIHQATALDTPLTKALAKVGSLLTLVISLVAVALLGVAWLRGQSLDDALLASIGLAVAAIPEGLPAIVTITLAIGVRRMAGRRAVVRRLPAVETLGSTSIICSDKTGTLTKNEMTVQILGTPSGTWRVSGTGYEPKGELLADGVRVSQPKPEIVELLSAGALCSDAVLRRKDDAWSIEGDPTEGALVVAFEKIAGSHGALRESLPRRDVFPFESENQFMATLHTREQGRHLLLVKGAPEVVLERCVFAKPEEKARFEEQVRAYAREGLRVLAFARRETESPTLDPALLEGGLEFVGLQAMIDPARPEAVQAIRDCHAAGIVVKMITGDHRETAQAIARQLGIDNGAPAVSGEELSKIADADLPRVAMRSNVFARVAPEHKLRLVRAIQSQGQVVAMTGDGVNDAPALKQADIGVAMGITGTSVSKEAAELVLTDDNFATIRAAVEEGRRVYDNLVKSLAFVLPTNLGEALIILVAVLFFPVVGGQVLMPILPVQILWINLVATVALALPLAFEAKEPDVMSRRPRDPAEPLFGPFVAWRTALMAVLMAAGAIALFFVEYRGLLNAGVEAERALREAQTMAVTTVIFFQIFYLFNCRSLKASIFSIGFFSNRTVFVGIAVLLVLHAAFVHLPQFNAIFSSAPLSAEAWLRSIAMGAVVLPVVALEKFWRSSRQNRR